jgi:hypothetical protein
MWLFIPYIVVQIALWLLSNGDFSVLAKSSDIFVILSTIRSAINLGDLNGLVSRLEDYVVRDLYREFRKKYIRRLDSVYIRHIETIILVIVSLALQFL